VDDLDESVCGGGGVVVVRLYGGGGSLLALTPVLVVHVAYKGECIQSYYCTGGKDWWDACKKRVGGGDELSLLKSHGAVSHTHVNAWGIGSADASVARMAPAAAGRSIHTVYW
jgi:hypothetical protein